MPCRCWYIWPKRERPYPPRSWQQLSAHLIVIYPDRRKAKGGWVYPAAHGPSGGLKLAKAPEEISLYDVILSMEGAVRTGEICGRPAAEIAQEMLALGEEYRKIEKMLEKTLKGITLIQILEKC